VERGATKMGGQRKDNDQSWRREKSSDVRGQSGRGWGVWGLGCNPARSGVFGRSVTKFSEIKSKATVKKRERGKFARTLNTTETSEPAGQCGRNIDVGLGLRARVKF